MSANGSSDLRAARIDLAAAFRWAARYELHEAVDNHLSFAPPGRDGAFLVNAYGKHWSEIGPDDLLLADGQGTVLEGEGFVEPSACSIHGGIHRRQPHARTVMHTHMPYAAALTLLEDGRLETAAHQTALRFHGAVAYDPVFAGLADATEEGERIADALGSARVLFLAHHGVIVVGETIAGCFHDLYLLERACRQQVLAMSTGRPLATVSENAAQATAADWEKNVALYSGEHFTALKRMLAREDPVFAE
jgi:ribulose-5-phosphate 4-epimerase/fuculose-1-phosphate aldolase